MKCYIHPDIDATHTCAECGRAICDACVMEINGKVLCRSCTEKLAGAQAPTQASAQNQPLAPPVSDSKLAPPTTKKEPILALILSFFIPGLGHIYDGLTKKGIYLIVAFVIICGLIFLTSAMTSFSTSISGSSSSPYACCSCIFFLAYLAVWIYGMYDSYISAQKINKGEKLEDKLF